MSLNTVPGGPPEPPPSIPAGWYPNPSAPGYRWWDGSQWSPQTALPTSSTAPGPAAYLPINLKSSGLAVVLTILWPGVGHLYLGLSHRGTPHVVANAIGLVLAFTLILLPVSLVIWLVTLCMTVGSISGDTVRVNEALRTGWPITH